MSYTESFKFTAQLDTLVDNFRSYERLFTEVTSDLNSRDILGSVNIASQNLSFLYKTKSKRYSFSEKIIPSLVLRKLLRALYPNASKFLEVPLTPIIDTTLPIKTFMDSPNLVFIAPPHIFRIGTPFTEIPVSLGNLQLEYMGFDTTNLSRDTSLADFDILDNFPFKICSETLPH